MTRTQHRVDRVWAPVAGTAPRTGARKAPARPRPTTGTHLLPAKPFQMPQLALQDASPPCCLVASTGPLPMHKLICCGADTQLTRADRVPIRVPGRVYYFSGHAIEAQPKQISQFALRESKQTHACRWKAVRR